MNIIETHDLCKQYGNALRVAHLDLDVPEGSVYGFLGPNGAGKSTTLKMILGLVRPTAGDIRVLGKKMDGGEPPGRAPAGGSPHREPQLLRPTLPGRRICASSRPSGGCREKISGRCCRSSGWMVSEARGWPHYSLGMKQRLGLAAALLGYPKLLILDEPTNGLDPAGIQEMRGADLLPARAVRHDGGGIQPPAQ